MWKVVLGVSISWLFSCTDAADAKVVVDIEATVAGLPTNVIGAVLMRYSCPPPTEGDCIDDDSDPSRKRIVLTARSEKAGSVEVSARGYAEERVVHSAAESFWGKSAESEPEVARVGLHSQFIPGEMRFVHLVPTNGCLQPLDSVPEIDPERLGTEEHPLVLDGCAEETESIDAGMDDKFDEDARGS